MSATLHQRGQGTATGGVPKTSVTFSKKPVRRAHCAFAATGKPGTFPSTLRRALRLCSQRARRRRRGYGEDSEEQAGKEGGEAEEGSEARTKASSRTGGGRRRVDHARRNLPPSRMVFRSQSRSGTGTFHRPQHGDRSVLPMDPATGRQVLWVNINKISSTYIPAWRSALFHGVQFPWPSEAPNAIGIRDIRTFGNLIDSAVLTYRHFGWRVT